MTSSENLISIASSDFFWVLIVIYITGVAFFYTSFTPNTLPDTTVPICSDFGPKRTKMVYQSK